MAGISNQARKAKGRNLQKKVQQAILTKYQELTEDDVRSCPMGSNGEDILLSSAAKAVFPYSVEAKARAKIALVYEAMDQAAGQNELTPLVVVKADRREPLVVIKLDDFFRLLG